MTPVSPRKYSFDRQSLVEVRKRLGLSQTKMANRLGIPPNTLSRWENGATVPDASSLAAIHSIAMEKGVTPVFFRKVPKLSPKGEGRSRLVVLWDFQNLGVNVNQIPDVDDWIRREMGSRFPSTTSRLFKAFSQPFQSQATDELVKRGWRVWEEYRNLDDEINHQAHSDTGHKPSDTILVLISMDGGFADLLAEMKSQSVKTFLLAPESADRSLLAQVGQERWIQWTQPFLLALPDLKL